MRCENAPNLEMNAKESPPGLHPALPLGDWAREEIDAIVIFVIDAVIFEDLIWLEATICNGTMPNNKRTIEKFPS